MTYRATKRNTPNKGETLVGSKEQAEKIIADLDRKLAGRLPGQNRATYLAAKATLYEALGDPRMLEAAQDAFKFSKTANTAALVAVALHHFGRLKESMQWYERAYRYPHEPGWEIDIGYSGALLFQGRFLEAWPIITQLKKRMVYAAYLPFWNGKPCKEVSVISEGGFGDLIHNCRYLPLMAEMGINVTVYLPDYFFEHGFTDLMGRQPWFPRIKKLIETPQHVPAAGFFDLPALFKTTLETIPNYPDVFKADPTRIESFSFLRSNTEEKPRVGFCWAARAMETPLCPDGVYRSLTKDQATRILAETRQKVNWFSLQKGESLPMLPQAELKSFDETAAIIANLDLVVTVDTVIAHLAAAMGKPTWVILSGAIDWKFGLEGDSCPWYPEMKLFRNNAFGFENSVRDVIESLKDVNV